MNSTDISKGIIKAVFILVAIGLGLYFIYLIKSVLLYVILSLIFTLISNPIVEFLRNKLKFSNLFAVITTLLFFIGLISLFLLMFVPLITSQSESLSLLNLNTLEKSIDILYQDVAKFLITYHIDITKILGDFKMSNLDFSLIPNVVNTLINTVGNIGVTIGAVFFITFFFLKDKVLFIVNFKRIIPSSHEDEILNSLEKINFLLSRYFIGLLLQLFIVFVLYWVILLSFGIKNAFIIAFICAVLNIIPYIGPLISTIIVGLFSMISNIGSDFQSDILPTTCYVMIGFFLVQIIDNNISQPLIFSNSTKSHPLEIFLVTIIFGLLFGIVGMIIAVPFYTILKVIGKEFFPENRIVKVLTRKI